MAESINSLKEMALRVLTTEAFRYINQVAYQDYQELAGQNAKLRGVTASYFTYNGTIYPNTTRNGETVRLVNVVAPALHYSLYEAYDGIVRRTTTAGTIEVSNYFRAVLSASANGIVLDELLPAILVGHLRGEFLAAEYAIIDGDISGTQPHHWEPIETTRRNIEAIKEHYAHTIAILRDQLMNKLLLESR